MPEEHLQTVTESEKALYDLVSRKRFLDLERVPLICNDIAKIEASLKLISNQMVTQDQFWPIKTLVYGFVALTMTAILGTLLTLVLTK